MKCPQCHKDIIPGSNLCPYCGYNFEDAETILFRKKKTTLSRKPWQAGLFSLIIPGLGQLYNRQIIKALIFFTSIVLVVFFFVRLFGSGLAYFLLFLFFLMETFMLFDALISAYSLSGISLSFEQRRNLLLMIILVLILVGGIGTHLVTNYFFQPSRIMVGIPEPELKSGDGILINKSIYRSQSPKQGELVLIVRGTTRGYLGTIVALPGEKVEMRKEKIYISGKPLPENYYPDNYSAEEEREIPQDTFLLLQYGRGNRKRWREISKKDIKGKVSMIYYPLERRKRLN